MKKLFLFVILLGFVACTTKPEEPEGIIFDTDMGPDYNDVGAMAVLHALADSCETKILATVSSNKLEATVPCIDVINTYFGRPDIPVGIVRGDGVNMDTWHKGRRWTHDLPTHFPHRIKNSATAEDAVTLYRRTLNAQPDTSVVVVTVGFFTNLKNLLQSSPDSISPLSGRELVQAKVKQLVSMAGFFPEGKEFNVMMDAPSAAYVFEQWPTPILISGFDIGEKIITGKQTAAMQVDDSPVREAYKMCLEQDNPQGRNSWDQSTVLVAIRGAAPYFDVERGTMHVTPSDSLNHWTPDPAGRHARLLMKMSAEEVAARIESLMMHQPMKH